MLLHTDEPSSQPGKTRRTSSDPFPFGARHLHAFQRNLPTWYSTEHRAMPWRGISDPYRIWVSEVMLQQTRVDQAEPYYHRFMERFPTVERLADASLDDVLKCWEGMGYYARARNLHKAARQIVQDFGGIIPQDEQAIRSLPGVGSYTAAAVLSIAYGKPLAVLDGNAVRVLTRVFRVEANAHRPTTRRRLQKTAQALMDRQRPGIFNQAIMELGATVCAPARPRCPTCPLQSVCAAALHGDPEAWPVTSPARQIPHFDIAVALVFDEAGHLLVQQRPEDAMLGGLWEFPGGKREPGETLGDTCRRELKEELDVTVVVDSLFHRLSHAYSHFRITLHAFRAHIVEGVPRSGAGRPLVWASPSDLGMLAFPRANRRLIERIQAMQT